MLSAQSVDPNTLLSTVIQATAVIVGILGGFLGSQLLVTAGQRSALADRLAELDRTIDEHSQRLEQIRSQRRAEVETAFFSDNLAHLVRSRGEVHDLGLLLERYPGVERGHVDRLARSTGQRIRAAFDTVRQAYPGDEYPDDDPDDLFDRIPATPPEESDLFVAVAREVSAERRAALAGERAEDNAPLRGEPRADPSLERESALNAALAETEAVRGGVHQQLGSLRFPDGLLAGIGVLLLVSVAGMGFPLVLMTLRPVPDAPLLRGVVTGTFVVGTVILLSYIGLLAWRLTRAPSPPDRGKATT